MAHNERKTLYNHTYSENSTISASYNIKIKIRKVTPLQQDFFYKSGKNVTKISDRVIDFRATFDTIDINKLLTILGDEIGLGGTALKWCESFLTNRTQRVKINGQYSDC